MADFALSNMSRLPASIVLLGLLYSKDDGLIGQQGSDLNLADLSTFPLTPIMVRAVDLWEFSYGHIASWSSICPDRGAGPLLYSRWR